MITAIVTYPLRASIGREACKAHYDKIAPGFRTVPGLISKQFIWSETGFGGGVYIWQNIESAKAFYQGPWLGGILERYGVYPHIEYFELLAFAETSAGEASLRQE